MPEKVFPCPCCGHLTVTGTGEYDLCPVCHWEDDPQELRWPDSGGGANGKSLVDSQQTYLELGAMDGSFLGHVRGADASEPLDGGWRAIDARLDSFELSGVELGSWDDFFAGPYWWRPNFWRRQVTQ